jgi:hypothetical protein
MNFKLYSKIILTILLFCITITASAQLNNYTFAQNTANIYEPWIGGESPFTSLKVGNGFNGNPLKVIYTNNSIGDTTADFSTGPGYPIGFNFTYHGESFDRVAVSTNGYIKLGQSNQPITLKNDSIAGSVFDGSTYNQDVIAAFQTSASIFNNPYAPYIDINIFTTGLPGNRIFVVQYYTSSYLNEGASLVVFNYEIQLSENNNSIQIVYEPFYNLATGFATLSTQAAVGLIDEQGNYSDRKVTSGINTWVTSVAGTSASDLCDYTSSLSPVGTAQNLAYTWTPPVPAPSAPTCPEAYILVDQFYPGGLGYGGDLYAGGSPADFYTPLNNAINISTNAVINWSDVSVTSNQPTTYDVYLDISNPPLVSVAQNLAATSYTPTTLAPNTKYYYSIVPKNTSGEDSACVGSFTTDSMPQYCPIIYPGDAFINSLNLNTFSFVGSDSNELIGKFSATAPYTTTLKRDTTYTCSGTLLGSTPSNPWSSANIGIWIDFNQDGDFDDPGDAITGGSAPANGSFTFSVPIPNTALLGNTVMRMRSNNVANLVPFNSCNADYSAQDFIITIAPSTSCQNFTISPIAANVNCYGQSNGSINLNAAGGATPYTINWTDGSSADEITDLTKGIYQATVTDANNCEIATPLIPVLQPMALSIDTATGSNNITTVLASGGTAPYSYLWNNGDTSSNSSNLAVGTYSITVTDAHGCDTTMQNIVIKQTTQGTIPPPPPPPPPVDSVKDSSVNIIVYPNPSVGTIYLKSQTQQKIHVQIVSEQGKVLLQGDYIINANAPASIDAASFAGGIYFLKVVGDKSSTVVKIIKQ